jgi:hypothetical protein
VAGSFGHRVCFEVRQKGAQIIAPSYLRAIAGKPGIPIGPTLGAGYADWVLGYCGYGGLNGVLYP